MTKVRNATLDFVAGVKAHPGPSLLAAAIGGTFGLIAAALVEVL